MVADRAKTGEPENLLDVMLYSLSILIHGQSQRGIDAADVPVAPDLTGFSFRDLSRLEEMIERWEAAMRAGLPALHRKLAQIAPR